MKHLILTRVLGNRGGNVIHANLARELMAQGVELEIIAFKAEGTEDFPDCERIRDGASLSNAAYCRVSKSTGTICGTLRNKLSEN